MRERLRVIGFMVMMTVVFGGMVATVNALLKDRIERNRRLASSRAVLEAFGSLNVGESRSPDAIVTLFEQTIREEGTGADARFILTAHPRRQAFFLRGDAYWGPLTGVMAVDLDAQTVLGIAFMEHSETPGLGARIDEPDFRTQFVGIGYGDAASTRLSFVSPGTAQRDLGQIDSITGATETSRAVERIINANLRAFLERAGAE